jgi:methionyl-tRNA formyltransferase
MVAVGVDLLVRAYPAVLDGTASRIPQDPARATSFGRRRPEDGRVSWAWPATRIVDMIRAVTHPFPGAFATGGSGRLWLWEGRVEPAGAGAPPGVVLEIRRGVGIAVAAGEGIVLLTRVQEAPAPEERADLWAVRRGLERGMLVGDPVR